MSASHSRSFDHHARGLGELVGAPCHVTRMGQVYDGRGSLMRPDLDGCWLRCPEIGKPLWLLVGADNWVRTSPVQSITIDDRAANVVSVRTLDARYRFVFPVSASA